MPNTPAKKNKGKSKNKSHSSSAAKPHSKAKADPNTSEDILAGQQAAPETVIAFPGVVPVAEFDEEQASLENAAEVPDAEQTLIEHDAEDLDEDVDEEFDEDFEEEQDLPEDTAEGLALVLIEELCKEEARQKNAAVDFDEDENHDETPGEGEEYSGEDVEAAEGLPEDAVVGLTLVPIEDLAEEEAPPKNTAAGLALVPIEDFDEDEIQPEDHIENWNWTVGFNAVSGEEPALAQAGEGEPFEAAAGAEADAENPSSGEEAAAWPFFRPGNKWPGIVAAIASGILMGVLLVTFVMPRTVSSSGGDLVALDGTLDDTPAGAPEVEYPALSPDVPVEVEAYDPTANAINKSSYAKTILPVTKDAGVQYVEETLFLGDANTKRMMRYRDTTGVTINNGVGAEMGIDDFLTRPCATFEGKGAITMPEAVAIMQPKRVVINFGTSNADMEIDAFIEHYNAAIAEVKERYPYSDIIIGAVFPVDIYRKHTEVSMKAIDQMNLALVELAEDTGCKFLNWDTALRDSETGFSAFEYTVQDGVHLSRAGMEAAFTYFRTHSYVAEDTRPKPLKKIPARLDAAPKLIKNDPKKISGPIDWDKMGAALPASSSSASEPGAAQDPASSTESVSLGRPERPVESSSASSPASSSSPSSPPSESSPSSSKPAPGSSSSAPSRPAPGGSSSSSPPSGSSSSPSSSKPPAESSKPPSESSKPPASSSAPSESTSPSESDPPPASSSYPEIKPPSDGSPYPEIDPPCAATQTPDSTSFGG